MVKPKVPIDVQVALYIKHRKELFNGNQAKSCSNEVFQILSEQLEMTTQAIRLSVVRNAKHILAADDDTSIGNESALPNETVNDVSVTVSENSFANQSIESVTSEKLEISEKSIENVSADKNQPVKEKTVSFNANVKAEDIFGVSYKKQGDKKRLKAATGWSWKLRNIIWDNFKSNCSWAFKSANPKVNGDIICIGGCNFCTAKLKISFLTGESMQVEITNYDSSVDHPQTRCRLIGEGKNYYSDKLKNAHAHSVHTAEANRLMKEGDPIPKQLPTENTMRIIKCRDTAINGRITTDVILALVKLKFDSNPSAIGDISIHPFYVSYQLPMQKEFYKMVTLRQRSIISADATGFNMYTSSFLPTNEKKKMPIFLYTIGCHGPDKTLPVYQVLSDRHTLSFIRSWVSEWTKENKKPNEVYLDDSAALVGAFIQTLTSCRNTNEYISWCMDSVLHGKPPPKAYIRLDRSHFVKSLHRLDVLNKEDTRRKVLFKRLFGFLITCENLDVIKKTIKNLFLVMKSEYATPACLEALDALKLFSAEDEATPSDDITIISEETLDSTFAHSDDDSYKGTSTYR